MEARDSFCFPMNTKNPNPSPIEKRFGFSWFGAAEVGLYEQISRLNNHRPFRLPPMRAATLNFFGTLSVRYELLAPM